MVTALRTTEEILTSVFCELREVKQELRSTQWRRAAADRRISQLERTVTRQATLLEKKDQIIATLRADVKTERRMSAELRTTIDRITADQRVAELNRCSDTSSTSASSSDQGPRYPTKQCGSGKPGRPAGQPGKAPAWNAVPDTTVELRPEQCPNGHHLGGLIGTLKESRQVTDISVTTTTT